MPQDRLLYKVAAERTSCSCVAMAILGDSVFEVLNRLLARLSYTTTFILLAVTSLWLLSSLFTHFQASVKGRLPFPPGSFGLPVIGETIQYVVAGRSYVGYRAWITRKLQKYGPCFKTHIMGNPVVFMDPPGGNKFLFQNEGKVVEMFWPGPMARLLGPNSLTLQLGEQYKITRRHLGSFFDHGIVTRYIEGVDSLAVKHFAQYWEGKDEVVAMDVIKKFTFVTICNLLMSLDERSVLEEFTVNLIAWSRGLLSLPINLPGFTYYKSLKAREFIQETLSTIVARRRQELNQGRVSKKAKLDVLNSFLTIPDENGLFLSDSAIKDNLLLLLFAGYDTSSATLSMTLFLVGKNPNVYEQLVQEHKSIVERKRANGENDSLTPEDVSAMKYTWRVLQETLRMQPPVVGLFRKALTDFEHNGYFVPKGWNLMWNNMLSHYNPAYFEDPETFNPSRWEQPPTPYTFLPFGGGPRTCPGMEFAKLEMLVFLHHLVRRYQWSLIDPEEPIVRDPMPSTAKRIPIRITEVNRL